MLSAKRAPTRVEDLEGLRVAIVGTGREGRSVASMLRRELRSVSLTALDQRDGESVDNWRRDFGPDIPVLVTEDCGEHSDLFDIAVVSPGFAPHNLLVQGLIAKGVALTSGTDLFFARFRDRIIAVTGSKGKSTTSALVHHILRAHGVDAVLGGNLGIPLWDLEPAEWIVAEVSSYQCHSLTHSPHTAVLTALFEEHLDWHGDFERYATDKLHLVGNTPGHVVLNLTQERLVAEFRERYPDLLAIGVGRDTEWTLEQREDGDVLVGHGKRVLSRAELPLLGEHNAWNALLAIQAVETVIEVDLPTVAEALRNFRPLANRLEPISDNSGVVFLNDSLATNPPALAAALRALRDNRVIAIIGGFDRGVDDDAFRQEIVSHPIAALIGIPDSGPQMLERVENWLIEAGIERSKWPRLVTVRDMSEAVSVARKIAKPGDIVTLSPGAPSFGRYRDYQDRADAFIAAIRESARP
jgi:UDP-N-acetylmuramoylalanine--D-glutamate ligase